MAVSEARAKWAVGPLEPASRRERPPRPAPGHGHQHVSLPGQTMFISRARLGDGSRWGSVETTCSHVLPVSCPRPFLRNRAPFSPNGEPACVADGPRSGKGGKVNSEMNASSEPAPLHLGHFPRSVPQEDKAHTGIGKVGGCDTPACPGGHCPNTWYYNYTHSIPRAERAAGLKGQALALGFPDTPFSSPC